MVVPNWEPDLDLVSNMEEKNLRAKEVISNFNSVK